jgi:sialate O-acetylesterase
MRASTLCTILVIALGIFVAPAHADVKPHPLISENMVLQQGMKVPIWGKADDGEEVTVRFQGQEQKTTAKDGAWRVDLAELKAGGPYEMTIAGKNTIHFKNVLVGEVWICSGQSNMEMAVWQTAGANQAISAAKNPMIRLLTVPKSPSAVPQHDVAVAWNECSPETVRNFTAVGYYFGLDLHKSRHVPVGLIHTSWGGTPAESWTSKASLESERSLAYMAENQSKALSGFPVALDKYLEKLGKYKETVTNAIAANADLPALPAAPTNPAKNAWGASTLYNGMIAPLIPYAIRGATWYQGESNAGRAYEYRTLLPAMIKDWRKDWNEGDFTFLIVQLAPFTQIVTEPTESDWAELREAQLLATQVLPKTGIAVITDVGETDDIHPRRKQPVGARLALAARALANGENIEYSGPVYKEMQVNGDRATLSFTHVDGGLVARGGPLTGFTIAGEDRKFVKANAMIQGNDKVVVWSSALHKPAAVRFGWANYPVVNLWNQAGLPASPFRTDDFPMQTNPHKEVTRSTAGR